MPDLKNFSVDILPDATVTIPQLRVSLQVVTSDATQHVLQDFTGARAIVWPTALATLSSDERKEMAEVLANWLLHKRGLL